MKSSFLNCLLNKLIDNKGYYYIKSKITNIINAFINN
jgi:hypothetical protein